MQRALLYSSLVHGAVLAAAVVGLPNWSDPPPLAPPVMTVEVLSEDAIAPETAPDPVSEVAPPEPEPEPETPPAETTRNVPPPPPAPEQIAALPEPDPVPGPEPEADAIPLPEAPAPAPEPAPEPEAAPTPEPEPERVVTPPPPRPTPPKRAPTPPQRDPEPQREPEPEVDRLASLLESVNKPREQVRKGDENRDGPAATQPVAPQRDTAPKAERQSLDRPTRLSAGEMDALRAQLRRCWNFPAGAKNPEDLIVEAKVLMRPDRTPARVEILDSGRLGDSFYRAAADAARRALLNPACHPFELPPNKAELWQTMILTFDPREMVQ